LRAFGEGHALLTPSRKVSDLQASGERLPRASLSFVSFWAHFQNCLLLCLLLCLLPVPLDPEDSGAFPWPFPATVLVRRGPSHIMRFIARCWPVLRVALRAISATQRMAGLNQALCDVTPQEAGRAGQCDLHAVSRMISAPPASPDTSQPRTGDSWSLFVVSIFRAVSYGML
jgi:hypothetical protein